MTMDKTNRLGDTTVEEDAIVEDTANASTAGQPIVSPASKNWSYPSVSPANTEIYQSWSHRDIPCTIGPEHHDDEDGRVLDDYDASIELSNNCRKFYFSHMKTAAEVRKSVSRSKKNKAATGKSEVSKRSRIDIAMDKLRHEMAELMDQDLSLMEQLLTLNDRIEEVKYNYMYSVSKDSLYASSCDLSASCDLEKSFDLRSGDPSDSEVSVFDLEVDDDLFYPEDDARTTKGVSSTIQSLETMSSVKGITTEKLLNESVLSLTDKNCHINTINTDTAVIGSNETEVGSRSDNCFNCESSICGDLPVENVSDTVSAGKDSITEESGSDSTDQNDDTLTDNEDGDEGIIDDDDDDADDDYDDDDDEPLLMSTGESASSGFVSGIESDDVIDC